MVDPFDIDLLAEAIAALVAGAQAFVVFRWHRVVTIEVDVAADPDVLYRRQAGDVLDVIDEMVDCRRLFGADEHAHARDAHDTASRRHLADRLVGLADRKSTRLNSS